MSKKILLAYHSAQKSIAAELVQTLSGTNANFEQVIAAPDSLDFYSKLKQRTAPTLLLISDNYLKSPETMVNALPNLQELFQRSDFKVLIVPGEDVAGKAVLTQFEKISHIIHYMNYWQDEYLAARQAGRKAGGLTEDMDQLIKTNREISTQVGELLRYLRDQEYWSFDKMKNEDFNSLLSFYQLTGSANSNISLPESSEIEEIIIDEAPVQESSPTTIEEEIEVDIPHHDEQSNRFALEEFPEEMNTADSNILQMESSREIIEEMPAIEAEEIAFQSSLDLINDFINKKEYDAAKVLLEQLVDSHPQEATVWSRLGLLAEEEGDFITAADQYSKAMELDANLPELDFKLGMIISNYQPDSMDIALKHFDKAIQKNPQHIEAYYQMAVLLNEKAERVDEAIPIFNKVLRLDPDHEFANYDLALIHFDQGDKQKARSYYIDAFKNNPELRTKVNDQAFDLQGVTTRYPSSALNVDHTQVVDEPIAKENEINIENAATEVVSEVPKPIKVKESTAPVVAQESTAEESNQPVSKEVKLKTVLITGGTAGIGKATALAFIKAGYRVIITGRRAERLSDFMAGLEIQQRTRVKTLAFDVRDINACQNALNLLPQEFQEVDILINNAGLASGMDPIHQGKIEDWNKMIDTNIKGVLFITRLISPGMVKRKSGHIINICSTAGHEVYPKGNVYCATKHAVDALTKGMRLDLFKYDIRVSQVSPSHVEETEFARVRFNWDEEKAKIYEDFNPLKSPDIAEAVLFIATRPPHVNIQDIVIMGTQQAMGGNMDRSGRKYD